MAIEKKHNAKAVIGAGIAATMLSLFNPAPALAGDVDAGRKIFTTNCAACHAGGGNNIIEKKNLRKEALEKYLDGGYNDVSVVTQVTKGKIAMPAYGGKLSEDDIANVSTYVFYQAENDTWEWPILK